MEAINVNVSHRFHSNAPPTIMECFPGELVSAARRCRRPPRDRGSRLHARHLPQDRVYHHAVQEDGGEDQQKIETGIYGDVKAISFSFEIMYRSFI